MKCFCVCLGGGEVGVELKKGKVKVKCEDTESDLKKDGSEMGGQ